MDDEVWKLVFAIAIAIAIGLSVWALKVAGDAREWTRLARLDAEEARLDAEEARGEAREPMGKVGTALAFVQDFTDGGFVRPVVPDPTPLQSDVSLLERRGWELKEQTGDFAKLTMKGIVSENGDTDVVWIAIFDRTEWSLYGDRMKVTLHGLRDAEDVLLTAERIERERGM